MSRVGGKRPGGTIERESLDVLATLAEASSKAIDETKRKAERTLYEMFGITAEAYVGAEEQARNHPRWRRVFVDADVDGVPAFNIATGGRDRPNLAVGVTCPRCGFWIGVEFRSPEGLASIREAPVRRCSRCSDLGRLTLVDVWTGCLEKEASS